MQKIPAKYKVAISIIVIASIVLTVLILIAKSKRQYIDYPMEGRTYHLLVADTPAEREKGLMNIREKKGFDGMIFIFSKKDYQTFWNKNTYLDLDLYWIDGKNIVGKSFLPSIEESKSIVRENSPGKIDKVIEIIR